MSTSTGISLHHRSWFVVAAALLAAAAIGALLLFLPGGDDPAATGPNTAADTGQHFATAYASGDTPEACRWASGTALEQLRGDGLCDRHAGWSTTANQATGCEIPSRQATAVKYATPDVVNNHKGFEILITGTPGAYRVSTLTTATGESFCTIYDDGDSG